MFKHPWLSRSLYSPEPYMNLFTPHQFNNNRHWRLGNVPFHLQPVPQSARLASASAAAPVTSVSIWQPRVLRWKLRSRGLWFHSLRAALSAVWSSVRLWVCAGLCIFVSALGLLSLPRRVESCQSFGWSDSVKSEMPPALRFAVVTRRFLRSCVLKVQAPGRCRKCPFASLGWALFNLL